MADLFYRQPVKNVQIIALGQHVTYWNYLGWRDVFSADNFTHRQKEYSSHFSLRSIYTPQMVVDGRYQFVGHNRKQALQSIRQAAQKTEFAKIISCFVHKKNKVRGLAKIQVANQTTSLLYTTANLYFAIAQKRLTTHIKSGENASRHLHYGSVVRSLAKVAQWRLGGKKKRWFKKPFFLQAGWKKSRLMYVAFLQSTHNGHVLTSRTCKTSF